jgi:outer membrane receptor protein involved in Fe transport
MHGRRTTIAMATMIALAAAMTVAQEPPKVPPGKPPADAVKPKPSVATGPLGTIEGKITDKKTGTPVIEAGIEVLGLGKRTKTDLDGKYSIRVPPGTYELRIFAPLYTGLRIPNVTVEVEATTTASTYLLASKQGVLVVEVIAKAAKRSDQAQLVRRKEQTIVSDSVSGESIAKSTDSDVAEVVQRAPSITVRDDKYVFVRGLNERYSYALLNGSRISSTDPSKRMVPLDLFPAEFVEGLQVVKTFSPEFPADFAGGAALIDLKERPAEPHLELGLSTGMNLDVTFRRFRTYRRDGGADYFGFGKNSRELPGRFGDNPPIALDDSADARGAAMSLQNIWRVGTIRAAPNAGIKLTGGHSWGPLGFELGLLYESAYKRKARALVRRFVFGGSQEEGFDTNRVVPLEDFRGDEYTFETRLSGLLSSAYTPTENHTIALTAFMNRDSEDAVTVLEGTSQRQVSSLLRRQYFQYTENELAFGQLRGDHELPLGIEVGWRSAFTRTTQDIPDARAYTQFNELPLAPGVPFRFSNTYGSGVRTFSQLVEHLTDSALDFTFPIPIWSELEAKFRTGSNYAYRGREHNLRTFRMQPTAGNLALPAERVLDPRLVGTSLDFRELTQGRDLFDATQEIIAGYAMLDVPLVRDWVRVSGGLRYEYSLIRLFTVGGRDSVDTTIRKLGKDLLPGATLTVTPRQDVKLTAAWSKTVTRPEFRELTPALYPDVGTSEPTVGEPKLQSIDIVNYDLRFDWYYSPAELFSLSLFHKKLKRPIERTFIGFSSFNAITFQNADSAEISGIEVEARKDFGFLHPRLKNLSLTTNFAYIESTTEPAKTQDAAIVGTVERGRKLQGQSPFIANGALEYALPDWGSFRLAYNTVETSIDIVGVVPLPSRLFERRNQLDASLVLKLDRLGLPATLKLSAENLMNDQFEYTQAGLRSTGYTKGVRFSLGTTFKF